MRSQYDAARSVKQSGNLLVLADWKTLNDVDERAPFKQQVGSRDIHLLVVDAVELAARVEDDGVAAVGLQTPFFKASDLNHESVVLALLEAQFPVEKHSGLRWFVSAAWDDELVLSYPSSR
ncbi:hypothetical protein PR003_g2395 [Phytophthora rubi]|uniref:Uncharacterized protein n=1 Tax=Phytophthora rubi TaxID=129364 RepID=A0A6A3JV56_9STRA|nr:hypothetical protein PR002_g19111 [Phytophthora rubi]KAE9050555.1 hypothetical protein PR001_g2284 [Phytophthora rubi]KAE9356287.1 hypothetical protein PR003_g2395 [Phytophthora rubi]